MEINVLFYINKNKILYSLMSRVSDNQAESESSCSESEKLEKNPFGDYLDTEKIQSFNQACERLQKFVKSVKSLSLDQNQELSNYLSKFQKPQNQKRNDDLHALDITDLAHQRVQRMIKSQKPKKNWTFGDRTILDWVVTHVALFRQYKNIEKQFTKKDWNLVASLIPGANTNSCMFKWLSLHKTNLNEASWSEQESELLKTLVAKYVNANKSILWKEVCKKLYLLNQNAAKNYRTRKQCKEHWVCKLNPNIKREPWTQEEDILLLQTIKQNSGLKKWVEMVKLFQGRTQNAVKNRFNYIIDKERKFIGKNRDQLELINGYLQRCYVEKFTIIIEPDSEERKNEMDKVKKKKSQKHKKSKKKGNELLDGSKSSTGIKIETKETDNMKMKKEQYGKIEKAAMFETSSGQMTMENWRGREDFLMMENLGQIGHFNHRANDTEYDFMCLNSSINDD